MAAQEMTAPSAVQTLQPDTRALLANPFWGALSTSHRDLAIHLKGGVLRYPAEIAPFCGVQDCHAEVDCDELLAQGDVYFGGVLPSLPPSVKVTRLGTILQMIGRPPNDVPAVVEDEIELSCVHADEMLALTDAAFPGLFRLRTCALGRYVGIRVNGLLVAMAGERLRLPGMREISGVCTRPGFTGRGYASYLIRRLLSDGSREVPFLHVSTVNARAIGVYERLGLQRSCEFPFVRVSRR